MFKLLSIILKLFLLLSFLTCIGIPAALFFLGIEKQPLLLTQPSIPANKVVRVKNILKENNMRTLKPGETRRIRLSEEDIRLLLAYGLGILPSARASAELAEQSAVVNMTFDLSQSPIEGYINLRTKWSQTESLVHLDELQIGSLKLPPLLIKGISLLVLQHLEQNSEQYRLIRQSIQSVDIQPAQIKVTYHLQPELVEQAKAALNQWVLPAELDAPVKVYQDELAKLSQHLPNRSSLTPVLSQLFFLAQSRSDTNTEAVLENRALLIALGVYMGKGGPLERFTSGMPSSNHRPLSLTLLGRDDLSKHYIYSAFITAAAGTDLANAVGLLKELDDSQGGSGFSFADLAADQAGVYLAELALEPKTAKALQLNMSRVNKEQEFMPAIHGLPEGIQELELSHKYGQLDNQAYAQVTNEIIRRINACDVFKVVSKP